MPETVEQNSTPNNIFKLPIVNDNPVGWGPNNQPDKYIDLPYQKFSKSDRIGKVISKLTRLITFP